MRVNHKQTFRQEFFGKDMWLPKRKRNDQVNPFYETVREVAPGDIVYSFADGATVSAWPECIVTPLRVRMNLAIGLAWDQKDWRVDIDFQHFTDRNANSTSAPRFRKTANCAMPKGRRSSQSDAASAWSVKKSRTWNGSGASPAWAGPKI